MNKKWVLLDLCLASSTNVFFGLTYVWEEYLFNDWKYGLIVMEARH